MSKKRILVIEDNHDNYELVRFLLDQAGYEVLAATDGLSGVKLAEEEKPDLILLDLAIPDLDGWEVAKRVRENPDMGKTLIVALTARTMPDELQRALDAGCNGYISKPINVESFQVKVEEYLESAG
jgi:two-component system cell cycle response regulator DivK